MLSFPHVRFLCKIKFVSWCSVWLLVSQFMIWIRRTGLKHGIKSMMCYKTWTYTFFFLFRETAHPYVNAVQDIAMTWLLRNKWGLCHRYIKFFTNISTSSGTDPVTSKPGTRFRRVRIRAFWGLFWCPITHTLCFCRESREYNIYSKSIEVYAWNAV